MGIFKDLNTLKVQTKEIKKNAPPIKDRMADAMTRMQNANAMIVDQTASATLAATGITTRATVTIAAPTGVVINMQHVYHVDLLVFPAGDAPFPSVFEGPVAPHLMGLCTPGTNVSVSYDPANTGRVLITGPSY